MSWAVSFAKPLFLSGSCSSFPQAGLICGPWTALRIMQNVAQHRTVNYINFMRFLFWLFFWSLNCTVLGYELCSDNSESPCDVTVRGMWSWALFPVSSRDPPSSLSPLVQRVLSWGWVLIASQLSILSAEGPTRLKDPFSFSTLRVVSGGSRFSLCGAFFPILRMSPAVRSHFPVAGRLMTPKAKGRLC